MPKLLNETEIEEVVRAIVQAAGRTQGTRQVTIAIDDHLTKTVGLDSVEMVRILSAVELKFDIEIPDEELRINRFETIGAIISFVRSTRDCSFVKNQEH